MITTVRIKFDKLLGQTPKAYLLRVNNTEQWFPARFCWNFILNKKLGGNTVIPTWLYREKFGCEPDISDAETIVEKHVPNKVENINTEPHADLIR